MLIAPLPLAAEPTIMGYVFHIFTHSDLLTPHKVSGVHIITHTTQEIAEDPKRQNATSYMPPDDLTFIEDENSKSRWMDTYPDDSLLKAQPPNAAV